MVITEEILAKRLLRLFRDNVYNVWKLYKLLESVVLDRESQFAVKLTKKLSNILGIETKLSIFFHPQTDG